MGTGEGAGDSTPLDPFSATLGATVTAIVGSTVRATRGWPVTAGALLREIGAVVGDGVVIVGEAVVAIVGAMPGAGVPVTVIFDWNTGAEESSGQERRGKGREGGGGSKVPAVLLLHGHSGKKPPVKTMMDSTLQYSLLHIC